jgi:formylglycine-generating enzyme required for sulfatase activity
MVSWYDAVRFCNALSTQVGLTPAYEIGTGPKPTLHLIEGTDGFRLPTEAEWECAAGAGAGTRFAGGNELDAAGWFNGNSDRTTQPVGLKPANAWGLFDMSGNVSEFTGDGSGNYPVGVVVNPRGDGTSTSPVVRGGDYRSAERACEVAQRNSCSPDSVLPSYGFRLARSVTL